MRIITVANQKGGVGKTTTAINLATALAAIGERVLIIDLDPQGNASTGLGIDRKQRDVSSYDVLTGAASVDEAAMPTAVPGLSVVPSTPVWREPFWVRSHTLRSTFQVNATS